MFTVPIYEYKCNNCGHYLEILQKISDSPLTQCPECKSDTLRKLVSAAAFKLKGTGWYETDFKDKKSKQKKDEKKTSTTEKTADKKDSKESSSSTKSDSSDSSSPKSAAGSS